MDRPAESECPDFSNGCFTPEADSVAMVIYHTRELYETRRRIYAYITNSPVLQADSTHYEMTLLRVRSMRETNELIDSALTELNKETEEVKLTDEQIRDVCCWLTRMCVSDQIENQQ